jgi:hypothetical protein
MGITLPHHKKVQYLPQMQFSQAWPSVWEAKPKQILYIVLCNTSSDWQDTAYSYYSNLATYNQTFWIS